jgi:alanine transaminase
VKRCKYEVRGPLVTRAQNYDANMKAAKAKALEQGVPFVSPYPFEEIIYCNIGNPHQLGQKPFSYARKVMALLEDDDHLNMLLNKKYYDHEANSIVRETYPADIIARALKLKAELGPGGLGAYSKSQGVDYVRKRICQHLKIRDGANVPVDTDWIYLSAGASNAIAEVLRLFCRDPQDAVFTPKPEYPIYNATITLLNATTVPYDLVETKCWEITAGALAKALEVAQSKGLKPKCVVVINPGNPTGCTMKPEDMRDIVKFCVDNRLVLMADEVYQTNIYDENVKWVSFKKIACEMEDPKYRKLELFSFHSISKGLMGECGHRGGYVECYNIDKNVTREFLKLFSKNLCCNVVGQLYIELMLHPPTIGDASYEQYKGERDVIFNSLKTRCDNLVTSMRSLKAYGVDVHHGSSSMYVFPTIRLTPTAVEKANEYAKIMAVENGGTALDYPPDFYYCSELLEHTGITVVPGSGFGQADGTYHFRTTFLPMPDKIIAVTDKWAAFHRQFMTENGWVVADK